MIFREAQVEDISQLQIVRNAVKENRLSDPALITEADYKNYLLYRGKGWLCEDDGQVIGFAIIDLVDHNVWALFVHHGFENKGIGKKLHDTMLDWYFTKTDLTIWLGTAPGTRAEKFYRKAGWKETSAYGKGEIKFEMTAESWKNRIKD